MNYIIMIALAFNFVITPAVFAADAVAPAPETAFDQAITKKQEEKKETKKKKKHGKKSAKKKKAS